MIGAWRRLVPLLVLLLGWAGAANYPECNSVTNVGSGLSEVTLTSFVPNAACWMAQTVGFLGKMGAFGGVAHFAAYLVAGLAFYTIVIQGFFQKRFGTAIRALLLAAVFLSPSFIPGVASGSGVVYLAQKFMLQSWVSVHVTTARLGEKALSDGPDGVREHIRKLAVELGKFSYATDMGHRVAAEISSHASDTGFLQDPTGFVQSQIQKDQSQSPDYGTLKDSWWFNAAYLLLLSLFTVFAAIIYATGLTIVISALLLPVGMAVAILGDFKPLRYVSFSWLWALLSVAILPFVVVLAANIALGIPTGIVLENLQANNTRTEQFLTDYANAVASGCGVTDVACTIATSSVVGQLESVMLGMASALRGLVFLVLGVIVALGIALSQVRRIPAIIGGLFGVAAGGESSGTGKNPLGAVVEAVGGAALVRNMGARLAGSAAKGGGKGKTQGGTASAGGGSGPSGGGGAPAPTAPAAQGQGAGQRLGGTAAVSGSAGASTSASPASGGAATATGSTTTSAGQAGAPNGASSAPNAATNTTSPPPASSGTSPTTPAGRAYSTATRVLNDPGAAAGRAGRRFGQAFADSAPGEAVQGAVRGAQEVGALHRERSARLAADRQMEVERRSASVPAPPSPDRFNLTTTNERAPSAPAAPDANLPDAPEDAQHAPPPEEGTQLRARRPRGDA